MLRVAVVGERTITCWQVLEESGTACANLAMGGAIDTASDSDFQDLASCSVRAFCNATGINLAGFDILAPVREPTVHPIFLEINYFFGRHGLGGSQAYYRMLNAEIERWITGLTAPAHSENDEKNSKRN